MAITVYGTLPQPIAELTIAGNEIWNVAAAPSEVVTLNGNVDGFAILDNHLPVLCRLDPGVADGWSDEDVVRRWIAVHRPSCLDVDNPAAVQAWIDQQCQDTARVARYRARLQDLGWFMKALKEPLARLANKEDDCKGTFGDKGGKGQA